MSFTDRKKIGWFKIAIILFWIFMTGSMIWREFAVAEDPLAGADLSQSALSGDQLWTGIYYKDKAGDRLVKIGYSVSSKKPLDIGYVFTQSGRMKLNVQGSTQTIRTTSEAVTNENYELMYFQFEMISDALKFKLSGRIDDNDDILLTIDTGMGSLRKETIELDEPPAMQLNIMDLLLSQGLEQGKTYSLPFFDPTTLSNEQVSVKALGMESIESGGETANVWHLRWSYKGINIDSWVDDKGNMLREEDDNFVTLRENREKALGEGWDDAADLDLVRAMAVPVKKQIDNPRKIKRMQVRVSGIPFDNYPITDWRQRAEFSDLISVEIEDLNEIPDPYIVPYRGEKWAVDLKSTAMIQADHPAIRAAAKDIVGDETDPLRAAEKIHEWVYRNIKKEPLASIPSAHEVLILKKGDCNEHTALTVALCRAAGIPSRILVGLVYHQDAFYYHAWPAVYVGRWVAIDPTFGDFPADATHIKLLEGDLDKQVDLVQIMGKVHIEVLEAK